MAGNCFKHSTYFHDLSSSQLFSPLVGTVVVSKYRFFNHSSIFKNTIVTFKLWEYILKMKHFHSNENCYSNIRALKGINNCCEVTIYILTFLPLPRERVGLTVHWAFSAIKPFGITSYVVFYHICRPQHSRSQQTVHLNTQCQPSRLSFASA